MSSLANDNTSCAEDAFDILAEAPTDYNVVKPAAGKLKAGGNVNGFSSTNTIGNDMTLPVDALVLPSQTNKKIFAHSMPSHDEATPKMPRPRKVNLPY